MCQLKQIENLAVLAARSEALSALWDQAVCGLLGYGGRLYGTRRRTGATFWRQLATINSVLPIAGHGTSSHPTLAKGQYNPILVTPSAQTNEPRAAPSSSGDSAKTMGTYRNSQPGGGISLQGAFQPHQIQWIGSCTSGARSNANARARPFWLLSKFVSRCFNSAEPHEGRGQKGGGGGECGVC